MKGGHQQFAANHNEGAGLLSSRQRKLGNCGTPWDLDSHEVLAGQSA